MDKLTASFPVACLAAILIASGAIGDESGLVAAPPQQAAERQDLSKSWLVPTLKEVTSEAQHTCTIKAIAIETILVVQPEGLRTSSRMGLCPTSMDDDAMLVMVPPHPISKG